MLSCEICEGFNNTYFKEHLRAAACFLSQKTFKPLHVKGLVAKILLVVIIALKGEIINVSVELHFGA